MICAWVFRAVARLSPVAALLVLVSCGVLGCARNYNMDAPKAFRAYEDSQDVKWTTADGVRLKVRQLENYPVGSLQFWKEALSEHLLRQGYTLTRERCFQTQAFNNQPPLPGCRLDFLLPHGSEDWVLMETLFVSGEDLYVVEAAGAFERFSKVDAEIQTALESFRLSGP
jgi:hypothetical protein